MKSLHIVCSAIAVLSATPSSAAEWWWVGTVSEGQKPIEQLLFADARSLSVAPDWTTVRTRQYYHSEPHPDVFYIEADSQVNCPTKRIRAIFTASYNRQERLLDSLSGGIWRDIPPGSLAFQIYRFACENDRPNKGPLPASRSISDAANLLMNAGRK